ncbi:MAG: hypothetical protein V3V22_09110, partial [Methylococcales bacterium]
KTDEKVTFDVNEYVGEITVINNTGYLKVMDPETGNQVKVFSKNDNNIPTQIRAQHYELQNYFGQTLDTIEVKVNKKVTIDVNEYVGTITFANNTGYVKMVDRETGDQVTVFSKNDNNKPTQIRAGTYQLVQEEIVIGEVDIVPKEEVIVE